MKKDRWLVRMIGLLLVSAVMMMSVSVAAGTDQDPLVTLSYLNERFMSELLDKVEEQIGQRNSQIVQQLGGHAVDKGEMSTGTFTVVTLTNGQVLTGDIGCEVMLRIGTAACVTPSNPGLIDETNAETLGNGKALVTNHMYMMTIEGRGVKATAATTKLLVRGTYTIA